MDSYGFFAKIFENNTDDKLIKALNNGLDFELEDESCRINFYTAALSIGSPDVVRACIHNGANPHFADMATLYSPFPTNSTLNIAMEAGRPDILQVLLEEGARPELLFQRGIAWNMRNNLCPETLKELDEAGRELLPDFKKSLDDGTKIIEVFRKAGTKIPGLENDYCNASFFKLDYNADLLQDKRPLSVREVETFFETSVCDEFVPYPFPCQGTRKNALWHYASPKAVKEALKSQNPDVKDKAGWTTLHHIALYGETGYYFAPDKIVQILIDAGANVNAGNKYGVTPVMIASGKAYSCEKMFEVVKVLIRNGADYRTKDRDPNGRRNARDWLMSNSSFRYDFQVTMIAEIFKEIEKSVEGVGLSGIDLDLLIKTLWGSPKNIELDLLRGADVNLHTSLDYTPLMMAAVFNDAEAVKFLLEHGADVSAKNNEGATALSLAARISDVESMSLIIEHGGDFDALRWIDRNYYTKCTQKAEGLKNTQETPEVMQLRNFGLEI